MGNFYDVNAGLTQPNIVGNFDQGVQTAQANALAASKQQAIDQAQSDQQTLRQLAPQVQQGDPTATSQAAAIDPAAAAAQQGVGDAQYQRLSGAIKFINQQPTPQAKEAAYQQTKAFFTQPGQTPPPDTYAQAQPILDQVASHIAQIEATKSQAPIKVGQGETLLDPNTHQPIYTAPSDPSKLQTVTGGDGRIYSVSANGATPIPILGGGNTPAGAPASSSTVPGALPAETQNYVPAVLAKLGGVVPLNPDGTASSALVNAVVQQESGGNPNAQSAKGAQGLAQVMPATGASPGFGVQPLQNNSPQENLRFGTDYLNAMLKKYSGNVPQALAAYNAGPGTVDAALANPNANTGFLTAKPKDSFTPLSATEVAGLGLPVGTVAQRGADGKVDVISKPDAGSAAVVAPGDPTKSGDDYLATLPAGMANVVKAIADGDQAPPSASSRSPAAQSLLQAVYAYDPTASATNLPTRTAARKSFTSGKDAQNMTALSQLALHLDHLNDQVGQTSGIGLPVVGSGVNNAINAVVNSSQDPTTGGVTAFNSTSNAVAHELRAVFANQGGGTQAELEENLKQLNANNSTAQKQAAIQNIAQLVHGRFGVLQDKYSQAMGKTEDPFQAHYPGAESTILKLMGAGTAGGSQAQSAAPPSTPSGGGWAIQKVSP